MRMTGDQDVQPLHLACGLDVFIQRTAYIGAPQTGLTRWRAFMDQRHGEIDFAFQLIDIALQPLHFIPRLDPDTCRSGNRIIKSKHAVQTDHANLHTIFFNNGVRLIPEHFAAVLVKDVALHDWKLRLAQLQQRIVPTVIEFMITHGDSVKIHGVHDIDNRLPLSQAADIWPGKIVASIQKPGGAIFRFLLFYHCRDIGPTANITCAIGNPGHFIRFDMGMKIVGINNRDIFGTRPERQRDQNTDSKHF